MGTFTIRDQRGGKVGTVSWDANGSQPRAKIPAYVKIADIYEKAGGVSEFLAKWDELVALHKPSKDRATWEPVLADWNAYVRSLRPAKPSLNGAQRRDRGMAQVSSAEDRQAWLAEGLKLIRAASHGSIISADDLRERSPALDDSCPHFNLWGTLLTKAHHAKLIVHEGYERSRRPERRASIQRTWRRT